MLTDLRRAHQNAYGHLEALIARKYPDATIWHWYRAVAAVRGQNLRRNDDRSNDVMMAADEEIQAAHDEYIRVLHAFYLARDGAGGVLGRI